MVGTARSMPGVVTTLNVLLRHFVVAVEPKE
jgi:hypothetical protein